MQTHRSNLLALFVITQKPLVGDDDKKIGNSFRFPLPPISELKPEEMTAWSQLTTGYQFDESGSRRMLTVREWQALRERNEQSGK